MKRADALKEYEVDSLGIISSPGKFEGLPFYALHFWESLLDGGADEDINSVAFFVVNSEDRAEYPELADVYAVAMEESEQGFVYMAEYANQSEYSAAVSEAESTEPCEDQS
jgi:hypothetical protein